MNFRSVFLSLSTLLLHTTIFSQCTFTSTAGYQVQVSIAPVNMVVTPNGGGCVYQTVLQYNIQFSGTNIPASLWTMQGRVGCYGIERTYDLPNSGGSGTVNSANFSGPFIAGNCSGYNATGCTTAIIIIQGPGIPYQEVPCAFAVFPNPLPIELIEFTGTKNDQSLDLKWSTASERNNDYFTLEHSVDGINFEVIDRVIGAGTTNERQEYSYPNAVLQGGINYYRLSQTDFDGTAKRLEIIAIEEDKLSSIFSVYPNPNVERKINISFNSTSKTPVTYKLYSMYGQLLGSEELYSTDQINKIELPEVGSQFILELEQDNQIIGREKVFVL